jgi:hypothetical protein
LITPFQGLADAQRPVTGRYPVLLIGKAFSLKIPRTFRQGYQVNCETGLKPDFTDLKTSVASKYDTYLTSLPHSIDNSRNQQK